MNAHCTHCSNYIFYIVPCSILIINKYTNRIEYKWSVVNQLITIYIIGIVKFITLPEEPLKLIISKLKWSDFLSSFIYWLLDGSKESKTSYNQWNIILLWLLLVLTFVIRFEAWNCSLAKTIIHASSFYKSSLLKATIQNSNNLEKVSKCSAFNR